MNKAVFVTGGTVGSGLACAERFAKEGYDVRPPKILCKS